MGTRKSSGPVSRQLRSMFAVWALLCFAMLPVRSQNFSSGFNFALPPFDSTSQEFFPLFPMRSIGSGDAISIDAEGHFAAGEQRMRFYGVNIVADGAFPQKSLAFPIAGRLRKMGINLVRFHHLDNPWSQYAIFEQGSDTRHLNPVTLDRLENFLVALKLNGIYANINLHVSRAVKVQDGIADADSIQDAGKGVCFFDPVLLSLHKEYARQLLTHINPYTGLPLVREPAMAMVEITNENSLYRLWRDAKLKPVGSGGMLTVRHHRMLDSLWHRYLAGLYGTTAALSQAWGEGVRADGPEQVVNGSFDKEPFPGRWSLEQHSPATGMLTRGVEPRHDGALCGLVRVTHGDGTDWHIQFKQTGLSIQRDSVYTVRFEARADSVRVMPVSVMQENSPWASYIWTTFTLDTAWQTYSLTFRAPETNMGGVRLSFSLGKATDNYWFDNVSMATTGMKGLVEGESIEAGSVRRIEVGECAGFSDQRVRDMTGFYIQLQNDYYDQMHAFLKDTLGVAVPVVGTNWNFGLPDRAVQSRLDYLDNHSHWDHPNFPGVPWSSTDWTVTNQPMVRSTDGATIGSLMNGTATKGKPYTISEYNHGYPNRYQPEAVLFLTAYGAFQEADGLMFFDYNGGTDWQSDFINGFFDIHRNSSMMSLIPSCAAAFRSGSIAKARQTVLLRLTADDVLLEPKVNAGGWSGPTIVPRTLPLQHGMRTESLAADASNIATLPPAPAAPYVTDTGEITWDPNGLLSVGSPRFVGATGFLPNFKNKQMGGLTLVDASDVATLTWVSLTDSVLSRSSRSLFTLSSRAQNSGMVWDGTTSVHDRWGAAPTTMYPVEVLVKLRINADSIEVRPLDATGRARDTSVMYMPTDTNTFTVLFSGLTDRTPWFGIRAFGHGVPGQVGMEPEPLPTRFELIQNFPNPFNPTTVVSSQYPVVSDVRIVIYDLLGREVAVLVNERRAAGTYRDSFDASGLASGVYIYRLTAGSFVAARTMLLLR